ncbi:MAG TPA: thymidylate synthase [Candidatus Woesebacteria bacterium]|nr:thymidylate synthase [Candidatus Woesebacteria bacterium]
MIDTQYRKLLQEVLDQGIRSTAQQGTDTISLIGAKPMRFRLADGFPMITERNMAPEFKNGKPTVWQQAVAEIIAFINGARTQKELVEFGCHWWEPWVSEAKCKKRGLETGDLGPGSYGAAFHDFPTSEGENINQFALMLQQMRERPHLKTHFISPWIPQYTARVKGRQQKVVVCPCHGWVHLRVFDNKLVLHMFQRSGDVPVGVPSNMIQYAALTMMIAAVLDLEPYEYVHTISDAHIFVDQIPAVKQMLEREPRQLPTMTLASVKKDLFAYRYTDFALSNYLPHPGIKMPVAV